MSKTSGPKCNCDACLKRYAYHAKYHKDNAAKVKIWHKEHRDRVKVKEAIGDLILAGKTPTAEQMAQFKALISTKKRS